MSQKATTALQAEPYAIQEDELSFEHWVYGFEAPGEVRERENKASLGPSTPTPRLKRDLLSRGHRSRITPIRRSDLLRPK